MELTPDRAAGAAERHPCPKCEAPVRVAQKTGLAQALASIRESVSIYRRLATHLPGAFTRDLASALGTGADVLDGLGRPRDALKLRRLIEAGALDKAADSLQETALP